MKKRYLLLGIVLLVVSACDSSFDGFFGNSSSGNDINNSSVVISQEEGKNYYKASNLRYSLRDINSQIGWNTSISTGNQKLLVVPVELSDYRNDYTEEKINNLETAFFGNSNDTAFESVTSYFFKSSYGKLSLSGEVTNVFKSSYSSSDLVKITNNKLTASDYIAKEFYTQADSSLLKQYDLDGDGYIDNCLFIYSNDYDSDEVDYLTFWAWCTYLLEKPDFNKPMVNNYMWASYEFLNDFYSNGYNSSKIETHTFIHETGHLLGLDDYYCYDASYGIKPWDCAGRLDMQSYNVGDHNAFSKIALGWIDPYVVTGSTEITLKTSSQYPEAIIINDNWNGSAFDEYILIEYYTPTGLNEVDSKNAYSSGNKMYDYNGLRIYHVDARIVKTSVNSSGELNQSDKYTDTINNDNNYYVVGASNSVYYSYLSDDYTSKYRLLHLLDEGGTNSLNNGNGNGTISGKYYYSGGPETNSTLWTGKSTFNASSNFFANGNKFNDKSNIGYSISVSNLTDEDCVVKITKK